MASDAVEQIKTRLSIIDVVAPYVELQQAGKNLKGKSPFTAEKTPSFFVSPDRGMYYCFSTSKGGDMFTFVQEMEGVDFKGALKILADKAGVELVPEDPKKRSEREQLYAIIEEATAFFQSQLTESPAASEYLVARGVKPLTIARWRLGFAPGPPTAGWRELSTALVAKGYDHAIALKAGLVKAGDSGKAPYDVFRDRIMFPIKDPSGRVIAFSGRILSKDSDAPKYVNSPETELFNKSEALYGYDFAKEGIRKFDFSLIVEGQFDVVLSHQAGYTNAVAVSGTALTPSHVALLQRLSNRVVLALDADRAGIAAVKRAADVMLVRGMDVKVAVLPEGKDPADLVSSDIKQFKHIIGHSVHVIEFLLQVLRAHAKDERSYKLQARDEVIPYVLKLQSHIDRDHFENVIATALGTTKEAVHLEVERVVQSARHAPAAAATTTPASVTERPATATRQQALIEYLVVAHAIIAPELRLALAQTLEQIVGADLNTLQAAIPVERQSGYTFTLETELATQSSLEQQRSLNEKLHELTLLQVREQLSKVKHQLYETERSGGDTSDLMNQIAQLQKSLTEASVPRNYFTATV